VEDAAVKHHVTIQGVEHTVEVGEPQADGTCPVRVDGQELTARWAPAAPDSPSEVWVAGGERTVHAVALPASAAHAGESRLVAGGRIVLAAVETDRERLRRAARPPEAAAGRAVVRSTLPGVIRRVLCQPGQAIADGAPLVTLEAMKMENELRAEANGVVKTVHVREGQVVDAGEALVELDVA
jgi:biotin carboxyl carrier protein